MSFFHREKVEERHITHSISPIGISLGETSNKAELLFDDIIKR
jgi:hypothetical protein